MNIKDLVGPFLLAVGLTFLVRSFLNWYQTPQIDVGFVAPLSKVEQEPLQLEVDFDDSQKTIAEQLTVITTDQGEYTFSNHGATLKKVELFRTVDGQKQQFTVLGNEPALERELEPFLVALDQKTPYYYELKKESHSAEEHVLVYESETAAGTISKEFRIKRASHKVEISVTVTPKSGQTMRPRLLWPSPFFADIASEEVVNALTINKSGKFVKTSEKNLNLREGFFNPALFGSEDKYFIVSMVDGTQFAQRAYYKLAERRLVSFLEAPTVTEKTAWTIVLYVGPKELSAITPVSKELESALDYGFFSPIAKGMLYLLNVCNGLVHNYGLSILLITLLLKLLLLPFSFRGQQKLKKMQDFQKQMAYLKQRYKNDPEAFRQAQEELIRKHGLPGMGGCLPLFLQIPFFFGLSSALNNSMELYKAPFYLWIHDLSAPDPYYVLPTLIAISVFLGTVTGSDAHKKDFKQVFMAFAMALFLGAWTANMAAGLALFIFANAFLHFIQTKAQQVLGL